jgi:hypothetical protein
MHVLLISSKFDGEIELRYDERGLLDKFEYRAKMTDEMVRSFYNSFPVSRSALTDMVAQSKTLRTKEVPLDTSFGAFWERYDRKINKKRCEPLYEKLSESERIPCIMAIKQYDFFLGRFPTRAKMDPENWLKKAGWETDWSKIK